MFDRSVILKKSKVANDFVINLKEPLNGDVPDPPSPPKTVKRLVPAWKEAPI